MGDDDVLAEEKSFGSDMDIDEAEQFSEDADGLKFEDEDNDDSDNDYN